MLTKNSTGEIKQLDESGSGVLVFASLGQPDKEDDILMPDAVGDQVVPMLPAHDWHEIPIGKATLYESDGEARADFHLNLNTRQGKNWLTKNLEPFAWEVSSPERELWGAVLLRALMDLYSASGIRRSAVRSGARAWFLSRSNAEGSFIFVCEILGFNPSAARRAIFRRQQFGGIRARYRWDFN